MADRFWDKMRGLTPALCATLAIGGTLGLSIETGAWTVAPAFASKFSFQGTGVAEGWTAGRVSASEPGLAGDGWSERSGNDIRRARLVNPQSGREIAQVVADESFWLAPETAAGRANSHARAVVGRHITLGGLFGDGFAASDQKREYEIVDVRAVPGSLSETSPETLSAPSDKEKAAERFYVVTCRQIDGQTGAGSEIVRIVVDAAVGGLAIDAAHDAPRSRNAL